MYEEDGEFKEMDMKGMESLMKMDKEMDNIMIESNDDDMIKSSIQNQLDALEQITKNMVQREELKKQCDHMITGFKEVNESVVNLPDDYKNVSERMTEEILEERKLGIFKVSETEKDEDSDFRRTVRSKLKSTFYGFAQQEGAKDIVKKNLDDEYLAGLERLRKLDIILKEKEMEEKAVKEMLKLERQKARLLEEEVRMKDSRLSCASKESSQSSSKSEVFLTQGKKSRVQEKDKLGEKKKAVKSISVQDISVNEAKEGGSVSGDGLKKGIRVKTNTQKEKHDDEFIKKNIRTAFVAENPHEIFLIQMDEKTRKRYDELLVEIENMEDSDALTKKYFDDVYGKDELQDETFEELDERIRKELAEESLSRSRGGEKDIIRERVEQKEMKRKLKELNERIDVRAS